MFFAFFRVIWIFSTVSLFGQTWLKPNSSNPKQGCQLRILEERYQYQKVLQCPVYEAGDDLGQQIASGQTWLKPNSSNPKPGCQLRILEERYQYQKALQCPVY